MFPFRERYGILGLQCGDPGERPEAVVQPESSHAREARKAPSGPKTVSRVEGPGARRNASRQWEKGALLEDAVGPGRK